ncbi:hypothetical protein A9Q83_18750 [Alphaproteobacteria bacterium 46_93_T64]|nr:hypothetical protein A9Q83_18750 [Alphaproteobacteria bacterium 46_93_T64]
MVVRVGIGPAKGAIGPTVNMSNAATGPVLAMVPAIRILPGNPSTALELLISAASIIASN